MMDRAAEPDRVESVLHRALAVGAQLLDAADVYSWGVTREFAALRAACCARLAAVAPSARNGQPAPDAARPFGGAAARGAVPAAVEPAR